MEASVAAFDGRRKLGLLSRLTRETRRARAGYREEFRFRVQRQEPDLCGLRTGVRLHRVRAGFLRAAWLHRAAPLPVVPSQPQGSPERRGRRQLVRWLRSRRRVFRAAARATAAAAATAPAIAARARCSRQPARTAVARPRSRSARPAASPSTAATASGACAEADRILSARAGPRPAEPALNHDPGRQPTGVVRFSVPSAYPCVASFTEHVRRSGALARHPAGTLTARRWRAIHW